MYLHTYIYFTQSQYVLKYMYKALHFDIYFDIKEITQYSLNIRIKVFLINQIDNYTNIRYKHKMRKK